MIRLAFYLLFFTLITLSLYWLDLNSGTILFNAFGYELETRFSYASIIIILAFFLFHFALNIISKIFSLPIALVHFLKGKKDKDSLDKLYIFLNDLYLDKVDDLEKVAQQLGHSNLPEKIRNSITLLATKFNGSAADNTETFRKLTKNKQTKKLGLLGLANTAIKNQDYAIAANYAQALWEIDKGISTARLLLKIYMLAGEWQKFSQLVDSFRLSYLLGYQTKNILLGIGRLKLAQEAYNSGDYGAALKDATLADKLLGRLFPTEELLIKIKIKQKNYKKALAEIKVAWQNEPSYNLSKLIFEISSKKFSDDFFDFALELANSAPQHYESRLLLARAALDIDQFDIAAREIGEALSDGHKVRACQLMAEFCLRTHGNSTEALSWLHYAMQAKSDIVAYQYVFNAEKLTLEKVKAESHSNTIVII